MSKPKSNSALNALSSAQQEQLESWLFDEKISYAQSVERVEKEFGIKTGASSIARFYRRTAEARTCAEFLATKNALPSLCKNELAGESSVVTMNLLMNRLIRLAIEKPDEIGQLAALSRIVVSFQSLAIKTGWLTLGRKREGIDEDEWEHERELMLEELKAYFKCRGMEIPPENETEEERMRREWHRIRRIRQEQAEAEAQANAETSPEPAFIKPA